MTNQFVIEKFLQGGKAKTKNLYSTGTELINYNTVIARWNGYEWQEKELQVNMYYYSKTTTTIQLKLCRLINEQKKKGNVPLLVLDGTSERVEKASRIIKGEI